MHVRCFNQFRKSGVLPALFHHEVRDDPGHLAAGFQAGVGTRPHQSEVARPVHQPDAAEGQKVSQLFGRLEIALVHLGAGGGVYAN